MSTFDRAYGALKAVMLTNERFDRIASELKALSNDLGKLASSHADLGQRVADIEGYLRAATGAPFGKPRLGER